MYFASGEIINNNGSYYVDVYLPSEVNLNRNLVGITLSYINTVMGEVLEEVGVTALIVSDNQLRIISTTSNLVGYVVNARILYVPEQLTN